MKRLRNVIHTRIGSTTLMSVGKLHVLNFLKIIKFRVRSRICERQVFRPYSGRMARIRRGFEFSFLFYLLFLLYKYPSLTLHLWISIVTQWIPTGLQCFLVVSQCFLAVNQWDLGIGLLNKPTTPFVNMWDEIPTMSVHWTMKTRIGRLWIPKIWVMATVTHGSNIDPNANFLINTVDCDILEM